MEMLRRDFLPQDLSVEMGTANVSGVVSVQARQTLAETNWLLQLAQQHPWILGVVGWVPLLEKECERLAGLLLSSPLLKGVRHVVQDEPPGFLDCSDFNANVARLINHNLCYDLLIYEHQLQEAISFVDRHPNQRFVIDHLAKPRVRDRRLEPWQANLADIAKRPHVVCKVSGITTEANWGQWTESFICNYLDIALEHFGPQRLMVGSDWPVCLLSCSYSRWFSLIKSWCEPLSESEQRAILETTAERTYALRLSSA